jgi:MFS family permease
LKLHRNIRLLGWFNLVSEFRLYGPIMILYYAQVSGSFALGMSVFSITMLASSLFEVPTGIFSDKIGRKRTVVAGSIAGIASVTYYAIGGSYASLLIGGILEGLARSFFSGNNDALLHDTLAESGQREAFQEYLGRVSSMYQVALAISAVLGSVIGAFSYSLVFWLTVIPQVIGLFISLRLVEPRQHVPVSGNIYAHLREALQNTVLNRRLRTLSAASIIGYALSESSWLFQSAFIQTLWPTWAIGFSQMLSNIGAAISFYFSGRLIKRFGEFKILISDILYSRFVNVVALLFPGVLSPLLMTTTALSFGAKTVAVGGLMQREFTDDQRATMGSLNAFVGNIVFAICSTLLGALADRIGPAHALLVTTLLGLLTLLLYRQVFSEKQPLITVENVAQSTQET